VHEHPVPAIGERMPKESTHQPKIGTLARTHASLIAVLLTFFVLGGLYNISQPLFEAPDEMAHFRYASWLATGHGLPDIITDLQAIGHEVGQPPLYYAMLAVVIAGIDTDDLEQIAPPNPYWHRGAGINAHYHTPAERFPYRNTALAVHLARFASTLVASLTIMSAYGLARIAAPKQAALAAALVAFNPQFIAISSSVSNDTLVSALSGVALLLLAWQLAPPRAPWWQYILLGAIWGLAIVTKLSGLALGAIIVIGLLCAAWRHRSWRPFVRGLSGVLVGAAITAGWWFVRNWMLYGDPLAWEELLGANRSLLRPTLLSWPDTLHYATYLQRSYWAMFGYGISAPTAFYQIVNVLAFVALIGVVVWFVRTGRRQLTRQPTLTVLLAAAWSLIVFVSLLRWMRLVTASNQGRLLFPAISGVAVLLALGSATFTRRRNWLGLTMMIFLLVWAVASPFLLIQPAYSQPEPLPDGEGIPNPVSIEFGGEIRLLGYSLPQPSVQAEESLAIELFWQALRPISESYVVALHALDPSGQVVAGLDVIPYGARYPTAVWQPGQPFRDTYSLPIEHGAIAGQAMLLLAVYPWERPEQALTAVIGENPVDPVVLTSFKIAPNETIEYSPSNSVDVTFGQQFKMMGFDLPETVKAGRPLTATLYWEALAPDGNDYTVFVHLLDDSGNLVAQGDSPPQANWYPTSIWTAGEQIRDPHKLFPPGDVAGGRYRLTVGLYDLDTGARLPAVDADGGRWLDDSVLLGSVELIRGP
jgi:hypothetical protein